MSVYEIKDLKTSLRALEVVLNAFPHDYEDLSVNDLGNLNIDSDMMVQQSGGSMHSHYESTDGDGSSDADVEDVGDHSDDESVETTAADAVSAFHPWYLYFNLLCILIFFKFIPFFALSPLFVFPPVHPLL